MAGKFGQNLKKISKEWWFITAVVVVLVAVFVVAPVMIYKGTKAARENAQQVAYEAQLKEEQQRAAEEAKKKASEQTSAVVSKVEEKQSSASEKTEPVKETVEIAKEEPKQEVKQEVSEPVVKEETPERIAVEKASKAVEEAKKEMEVAVAEAKKAKAEVESVTSSLVSKIAASLSKKTQTASEKSSKAVVLEPIEKAYDIAGNIVKVKADTGKAIIEYPKTLSTNDIIDAFSYLMDNFGAYLSDVYFSFDEEGKLTITYPDYFGESEFALAEEVLMAVVPAYVNSKVAQQKVEIKTEAVSQAEEAKTVAEKIAQAAEEKSSVVLKPIHRKYVLNGMILDVLADVGKATVTYPSYITQSQIYSAAKAAMSVYGDYLKDVTIQVVEPGKFVLTYPETYGEEEFAFAENILSTALPNYVASVIKAQEKKAAEEKAAIKAAEVAKAEAKKAEEEIKAKAEVAAKAEAEAKAKAEAAKVEAAKAEAEAKAKAKAEAEAKAKAKAKVVLEPIHKTYDLNGMIIDVLADVGKATVTYPSFITEDEIYSAAKAAMSVYGDYLKDVTIQVVEPGKFVLTYPKSYGEEEFAFAEKILTKALPDYVASVIKAAEEKAAIKAAELAKAEAEKVAEAKAKAEAEAELKAKAEAEAKAKAESATKTSPIKVDSLIKEALEKAAKQAEEKKTEAETKVEEKAAEVEKVSSEVAQKVEEKIPEVLEPVSTEPEVIETIFDDWTYKQGVTFDYAPVTFFDGKSYGVTFGLGYEVLINNKFGLGVDVDLNLLKPGVVAVMGNVDVLAEASFQYSILDKAKIRLGLAVGGRIFSVEDKGLVFKTSAGVKYEIYKNLYLNASVSLDIFNSQLVLQPRVVSVTYEF